MCGKFYSHVTIDSTFTLVLVTCYDPFLKDEGVVGFQYPLFFILHHLFVILDSFAIYLSSLIFQHSFLTPYVPYIYIPFERGGGEGGCNGNGK